MHVAKTGNLEKLLRIIIVLILEEIPVPVEDRKLLYLFALNFNLLAYEPFWLHKLQCNSDV